MNGFTHKQETRWRVISQSNTVRIANHCCRGIDFVNMSKTNIYRSLIKYHHNGIPMGSGRKADIEKFVKMMDEAAKTTIDTSKIKDRWLTDKGWSKLREATSEPAPCPDCKGGEVHQDCPACEGTGLASEPASEKAPEVSDGEWLTVEECVPVLRLLCENGCDSLAIADYFNALLTIKYGKLPVVSKALLEELWGYCDDVPWELQQKVMLALGITPKDGGVK